MSRSLLKCLHLHVILMEIGRNTCFEFHKNFINFKIFSKQQKSLNPKPYFFTCGFEELRYEM